MTTPKRGRHLADETPAKDPGPGLVHLDVPRPLHARLQEYQRAISFGKGRKWVPLSDVLEYLLDLADVQAALLAEALEAER